MWHYYTTTSLEKGLYCTFTFEIVRVGLSPRMHIELSSFKHVILDGRPGNKVSYIITTHVYMGPHHNRIMAYIDFSVITYKYI